MSDFLKKFLLDDPRHSRTGGRGVALAAFGKHPGWDDHVEDLGLETESLNFAKTVLYVSGIGGQIDSGAWEKLEPAQQLPGFKHIFLWQRSGQMLIGRMWSSSDGKGRKRYPLVVCLHFIGVTLGWALKQALPVLAELENECLSTTSAEDVRALLARKRAALRAAIQSTDGRGEYAPLAPDSLYRILNPAGEAKPDGFLRVLYQTQSQLGGFAPGTFSVRAGSGSVRVQQIRVPMAGETPELALLFWTRFFLVYIDQSAPLLLTLPLEADWLDVTVGEPESKEMFCLRATPRAVPMVSEVPYKLEEDFRSKAIAFLESFQRGETKKPDLQSAAAPTHPAHVPRKGGWLKWLGLGSGLVLGMVAAFLWVLRNSDEPTVVNPPNPGSDVSKTATNQRGSASPAALSGVTTTSAETTKSPLDAEAARLKAETRAAANEREGKPAGAPSKENRLVDADKQAASQKEPEEQAKTTEEVAVKSNPGAATEGKTELAASVVNPPAIAQDDAKAVVAPGQSSGTRSAQMTNSIGMVLVLLPSGMWAGKYEVTQAEYLKVMGTNPSKSIEERQPVEKVSWNDAVEFTRKLTQLEQNSLPSGRIYSLPTEKQWQEFLAGQKFEDLPGASISGPSVVGQAGPPNKLGLYDVLGNVWQWCLDDAPGDQKLLKGGAFNSRTNYNRTLRPDMTSASCGFRCVLSATEP